MTYDQIAASYLLRGRPIPAALLEDARHALGEECPDCKSPFLVEKVTKQGTAIRCPVKGCGYKEASE